MRRCLLTLTLLTITTLFASAQTQTVNASIKPVLVLTAGAAPTLAPFETALNLENGIESSAVAFTVKTNQQWKFYTAITSITPSQITNGPTSWSNPLAPANIAWGTTTTNGSVSSSDYHPFTTLTTAEEVKSGVKGGPAVAGNSFDLKFKITPGYTVDPAAYAVVVTYTVSNY